MKKVKTVHVCEMVGCKFETEADDVMEIIKIGTERKSPKFEVCPECAAKLRDKLGFGEVVR